MAIPSGKGVLLVRKTKHYYALCAEENDRREYWKPIRYFEAATEAENAGDWFAAVWNLKRLDELKPKLVPELKRLTCHVYGEDAELHANIAARRKRAEDELASRVRQRAENAPSR